MFHEVRFEGAVGRFEWTQIQSFWIYTCPGTKHKFTKYHVKYLYAPLCIISLSFFETTCSLLKACKTISLADKVFTLRLINKYF